MESIGPSKTKLGMIALGLLVGAAIVGCGDAKKASSSGSSSSTPVTTPGSAGDFAATTVFGLKVESILDGLTAVVVEKVCEVASGTTVGTVATCAVAIPEARLFFSSLHFTVHAKDPLDCTTIQFFPYFYASSVSAAFQPTWTDAPIDCSTAPISADCFNGTAIDIVPGFPSFTGLAFSPGGPVTKTYNKAQSAFAKRRGSNRWSTNNLITRTANIAISGEPYLANTMRDYRIYCRDKWEEIVYGITLTISDQDTSVGENPGGATDHFSDWNGL